MRFFTYILILFLQISVVFGSNENSVHSLDKRVVQSSHPKITFNKVNLETEAKNYLVSSLENLKSIHNDIELISNIRSPYATHLTYLQTYNGIPVYRSQIKINIRKNGEVLSLFDNSYSFTDRNQIPTISSLNSFKSSTNNVAESFISENYSNITEQEIEKIIVFDDQNIPKPAFKIKVYDEISGNYDESIIDIDGEIIYQRDLRMRSASADSLVSGMVFLPDPLTTAGVEYGSPYEDYSDGYVSVLNDEMVSVTFTASFSGGTYSLVSDNIKITDIRAPYISPVTENSPSFNYTRDENGFEDVNAFYHLNTFHHYITDSVDGLGFTNLLNEQVHVDPHGDNGDVSYYYPQTPKKITFGIGGVDDAEDADVLIHEFGHAISDAAAPGGNSGNERSALDEGLCDYLAVSYSRSINAYKWENMFSWDGHNPYFDGRTAATTKTYPSGMKTNDIHASGEIWSSTLMEIWEVLGRKTTDKLLIQAMYSYVANVSFPKAAKLMLQADTLINGGVNIDVLYQKFVARGILSWPNGINSEFKIQNSKFIITNSEQFALGGELIIRSEIPQNIQIGLYDVQGRLIETQTHTNFTNCLISGASLQKGVYF
ncbi:MAG: hypothetical protein COC01_05750, partial [Bacteroidetes bacterium]